MSAVGGSRTKRAEERKGEEAEARQGEEERRGEKGTVGGEKGARGRTSGRERREGVGEWGGSGRLIGGCISPDSSMRDASDASQAKRKPIFRNYQKRWVKYNQLRSFSIVASFNL